MNQADNRANEEMERLTVLLEDFEISDKRIKTVKRHDSKWTWKYFNNIGE